MLLNSEQTLLKGTFRAPAGELIIGGNYNYGNLFDVSETASFEANNGIVAFELDSDHCYQNLSGNYFDLPTSSPIVFHNLTFRSASFFPGQCTEPNHYRLKDNQTLKVTGALTLGDAILMGGQIEAEGNVTITGDFRATSTTALRFRGINEQIFTHAAGGMINGPIEINKTGGSVTLGSNITLNAGQNLTLTAGTLNQAAAPTGFTLTIPGILTLQPGTTLNQMGGSLTYGTLTNNGGTLTP